MKIKIMNLYSFDSRWRDNITQFVNQNRIRREDIQDIVYDSERKCFTLFYWSFKDYQELDESIEDTDDTEEPDEIEFDDINIELDDMNIELDDGSYTLNSNPHILVGTKPYKVKIFEESFKVDTWKGLVQHFLKYLYFTDSKIFLRSDVVKNSKMFSFEPYELVVPMNITEDFYFEGHRGVVDLFRLMNSFCDDFEGEFVEDIRKNVKIYLKY